MTFSHISSSLKSFSPDKGVVRPLRSQLEWGWQMQSLASEWGTPNGLAAPQLQQEVCGDDNLVFNVPA